MANTPTLKQRIIAIFLTALFIGYVGNTTVFIHEHEVGGIKVAHSHPYTSSSHSHTANTIAAISLLSHVLVLADFGACEVAPVELLLCVLEQNQEHLCDFAAKIVISLRAPPIL